MKKRNLKLIIVSSLLALSFGATSVGTTFALFTDKADTTISVTSGIVDINSTVKLVSYSSTVEGESGNHTFTTDSSYTNPLTGSSFSIDGNEVTIDKMVPGDVLTLEVTNTNLSNVETLTRFVATHATVGTKTDLFPALDVTLEAKKGDNTTIENPSLWAETPAASSTEGDLLSTVKVTITFTDHNEGILAREEGIDNAYQDAACTINFSMQAVQGNAAIDPIDIINSYLAQEDFKGNGNNTMHDALADVATLGYETTALEGYVWSVTEDQFVAETVATVDKYNYFKIVSSATEGNGYSLYANESFPAGEVNLVGIGFDAGNHTDFTNITYIGTTAARSVIIRTNGGNLVANAPLDTVTHYGTADTVNIVDVNSHSYHENGTVKFLEVAAGHVVLEKTAEVDSLHFDATQGAFGNEEKSISIDLSAINKENYPSFSRDQVEIDTNGTFVAEVTTNTTDYIWLWGNGVKEMMVVSDSNETIAENGTLKAGLSEGAEDGSIAEQIANPALRNDEGKLVGEDGETLVTPENAVVENLPSKEEVKAQVNKFAGGQGTETSPYLVSNYYELVNVAEVESETKVYFKLTNDINVKEHDSNSWCHTDTYDKTVSLNIDLNEHKILMGNKFLFGYASNLEMHNGSIEFDSDESRASVIGYACYQNIDNYDIYFHDLVISGEALNNGASHYGPLISYAFGINSGSAVIKAENITNNMTIKSTNSTGYVGGLFGYVQGSNVKVEVKNCSFNGAIVGAYVASFINPCSAPNAAAVISEGNTLNGTLLGSKTAIPFGCNGNVKGGTNALNELQSSVTLKENAKVTKVAASTSLISVENNEVKLSKAESVDNYIVAITFNVDMADGSSGGYPRYITKTFEQFEADSINTGIYQYAIVQETEDLSAGKTIVTNSSSTVIWLDNGAYHVYCPGYKVSNNKATIYAYGYKDGNIVTYQTIGYTF